ncbi:DNA-3-methyladenine glycosylase 2 [compost metagenome]
MIDANPYRELYRNAERHLAAIDVDWARLMAEVGPCALLPRPAIEPYQELIRAIAHQQLHGKAAEAILARFRDLYPDGLFPTPEQVLATPSEALRGCGFSTRKIETLRAIAEGALTGIVPGRAAAEDMRDEELIARLVGIRGIGRWTVEMLLIFGFARMDILPVDDFGVREGYKRLKGLDKAPTPKALTAIGQAWSPYRTVASWYLWRVPRP